jgi:hypothetical protein
MEKSDLPVADEHIGKSWLSTKAMISTLSVATAESLFCHRVLNQTTDMSLMALMIAILPTFFTSFFSGYSNVQDELKPLSSHEKILFETKPEYKPSFFNRLKARFTFSKGSQPSRLSPS